MASVSIRLARLSELLELEQLQWRASLSNPGDKEALLANPDAIELPQEQITNGQVFVAEHGDRLVGFAAVLDRPDSDAEVDGLFVDPTCWRQGIGRALIERCVGYAQHSNSRGLRVIGNPHARGFYERVGFRAEGTYQTRFGQGIVMRRGLDRRP